MMIQSPSLIFFEPLNKTMLDVIEYMEQLEILESAEKKKDNEKTDKKKLTNPKLSQVSPRKMVKSSRNGKGAMTQNLLRTTPKILCILPRE